MIFIEYDIGGYMVHHRFKITFNSPVIVGFTGICLLTLFLNWITNGLSNSLFFSVYRAPLNNPLSYIRLIGHVFGHVNWEHFIGNSMLILVVGPLLEEKYGSMSIALVIGVTAVVTGLIHTAIFPGTMLLGASGVVFALILLSSFTSVKEGEVPITFILVACIYIGEQIYQGIMIEDNISNLTHIVGGIVGASFGNVFNRRKRQEDSY